MNGMHYDWHMGLCWIIGFFVIVVIAMIIVKVVNQNKK